jgi:predicted transcriptional regulator
MHWSKISLSSAHPSLTYVGRLADVLLKYERLNVTNLAMLSRINHKRCGALLDTLKMLDYIDKQEADGQVFFFLTKKGKEYAMKVRDVVNGLQVAIK